MVFRQKPLSSLSRPKHIELLLYVLQAFLHTSTQNKRIYPAFFLEIYGDLTGKEVGRLPMVRFILSGRKFVGTCGQITVLYQFYHKCTKINPKLIFLFHGHFDAMIFKKGLFIQRVVGFNKSYGT